MNKRHWMVIAAFTVTILLEVCVRFVAKAIYGQQLYILWPPIDNITHFMWGFSFFLVFLLLLKWDLPDSILGSFFIHMLWEAMEIVGDKLFPQPGMSDHFFFDGIVDTLMFIVGGCVVWALLARRYKSQQHVKLRSFFEKYLFSSVILCIIGGILYIKSIIDGVKFESPDIFALIWIFGSAALIAAYELITHSLKKTSYIAKKRNSATF
jgi:hypothetical protein